LREIEREREREDGQNSLVILMPEVVFVSLLNHGDDENEKHGQEPGIKIIQTFFFVSNEEVQ
jgi:hypothetical protein